MTKSLIVASLLTGRKVVSGCPLTQPLVRTPRSSPQYTCCQVDVLDCETSGLHPALGVCGLLILGNSPLRAGPVAVCFAFGREADGTL